MSAGFTGKLYGCVLLSTMKYYRTGLELCHMLISLFLAGARSYHLTKKKVVEFVANRTPCCNRDSLGVVKYKRALEVKVREK
jgi:hypothetical protein